jgi:type IV pilus assembly protein PilQ
MKNTPGTFTLATLGLWLCALWSTAGAQETNEVTLVSTTATVSVTIELAPETATNQVDILEMDATTNLVVSSSDPSQVPEIQMGAEERVEGVEIESSDKGEGELITITLDNVRLADVVRIFAQTSGANIIIPDGLEQPVSANLHDVGWREGLDVILEDKGFIMLERRPGIFSIVNKSALKSEPLAVETLTLKYITVPLALPAVQGMVISSNAKVTPLAAANVIIISETPQQIVEIKKILELIDQPRKQVFIESKFVELNDQAIQDLGINWQVLEGYTIRATAMSVEYTETQTRSDQDAQAFVSSRVNNRSSLNSQNIVDDTAAPPPTDVSTTTRTRNQSQNILDAVVQGKNFSGFDAAEGTITTTPATETETVRSAILSADDLALTLSALKQLDGVRIVSNPKMLVANGETANIHVGRNEPNIRAVPQGENGTSYAYELDGFIEIGVKVEVTPTINTERNISIKIIPELSRLLGEKAAGEAGTTFPITQIRRIKTEFAVESGKTVAIGGLTQSEDNEVVKKVPLLGDIPIIGKFLFTHTRTEQIQDEIIIFVSVDMAHVEALNASKGIPEHGKLIQTWLQQNAGGSGKVREKSIDEILAEINLGD